MRILARLSAESPNHPFAYRRPPGLFDIPGLPLGENIAVVALPAPRGACKTQAMPPKKSKEEEETLSFEGSFDRLSKIVERLESGEGTLTEMTELFEEGVRLSKRCVDDLDGIEKKVEILLGDNPDEAAPFHEEESSAS